MSACDILQTDDTALHINFKILMISRSHEVLQYLTHIFTLTLMF